MADIIESAENSKLLGSSIGIFKEYVGDNSLHLTNCINTSRTTILEMLQLRGYDISSISNNLLITNETDQDKLAIKVKNEDANEITHVYYNISNTRTNHKKLSSKVESIMKAINEENKKRNTEINIIFIVLDVITPSVREAIKILNKKYNIYMQVFPIKQLMFNVTKHRIVPEHIRIKKLANVKDFLQSLHIDTLDKLPKILSSDPVAMFIGLRPGELCRVIRPSQSAGIHNVYRYCISE